MHQTGSGVLGPVYRARLSDSDPQDRDRVFALKAFHVDLTPEQTILFGDALQKIVDVGVSHAAVVSPVGAGVTDEVPYLAYEYVAADSLDVTMRHRPPASAEIVLPFIVQLAEGLDAAHGRGLAHGALHLRDVFVTPDLARVSGFGIVAALDRVGQRGPLRPPYAAQEQIAGVDWGPAADRYAFAAVAYELLTGRRAGAVGSRMAEHLEQVLDAGAARRLMPLFETALAEDPGRRPSAAGRFADDLAVALGWTGAAGVRHALAGMGAGNADEPGRGRGPGRVDGADAPLGGGPAAAAVGGTGMRKRKKRTPWSRKQSDVDWTKRALDLSAPDERPPAEGGSPLEDADDDDDMEGPDPAGPGADPLDMALDGGVAPDTGDDLELRAGGDALADVAEGLDAGLRHGRGGAGAGDGDMEPRVVDGYSPISVGDLESRVEGGGADPAAAESEVGSRREYDPGDAPKAIRGVDEDDEPEAGEPGLQAAGADDAGDVDAAAGDDGFVLESEEEEEEDGYDYGPEDDVEPEDPAGDIFDGGERDPARRLPVALVAGIGVAVVVTAFVIGLGWMSGGDDAPAAVEEAEAPGAGGNPGRPFSEAVVDEPPPEPAAVEPIVEPENETPNVARPSPGGRRPVAAPRPEPAPAAAREPDPPPPAAPAEQAPAVLDGRLLVRSMPPGAGVIVNGELRGTTPFALADLPYGPYEVEVTLAGYESRTATIVLDEDDPIGSFSADLTVEPAEPPAARAAPAGPSPRTEVETGASLADTRPPGAPVRLARRFIGDAPASMPDPLADTHRTRFRREGYRTSTDTVQVAPTQARAAASLDDAAR